MKRIRILRILAVSFLLFQANVFCAEIQWTGSPNPIPSDGNIYYVNTNVTISVDLTISGTLEIRSGGTLTIDGGTTNHNNTVRVLDGGTMYIETNYLIAMSSTAYLNVYDGGTCRIRSGAIVFYAGAGNTGIINVYGGALTVNAGLASSSGHGRLNQYGGRISIFTSGILYMSTTLHSNVSSIINIYDGLFQVDDGELRCQPHSTSVGEINVYGGELLNKTSSLINLGYLDDSHGTLNVYGGKVNAKGGTIYVARGDNSTGTVNVNGGLFNINGGAIRNGEGASSTANFTVDGGTFRLWSANFRNAYNATSSGTLNINSGGFILKGGNLYQDSGTASATIFGVTLPTSGTPISSGAWTLGGGDVMTIPQDGALSILSGGSITNNGTITNNNLVVVYSGATFDNSGGTFNNNRTFIDLRTPPFNFTVLDRTIIPSGTTLSLGEDSVLHITDAFENKSNATINTSGLTYTYSKIDNGDALDPGTINIKKPGALYLLGGKLNNNHADSVINIENGGSLYNYFGEVNLGSAGSDSLNLFHGSSFHNARGNAPGPFTANAGCVYTDEPVATLDRMLEVDYTWTITDKAVIKGNGHKIEFGPNGKIWLHGPDASLFLDDVILQDVSGDKIRCLDTNGTLSLHNVIWTQDTTFNFSWGKLHTSGEWLIDGEGTTFNYSSPHGLTIASDSVIHVKQTTFQYSGPTNDLIQMTDATSNINLNRGTLLAATNCTLAAGSIYTTGLGTLNGIGTLDIQNIDQLYVLGSVRKIGNVIS